jgi:hypothetical protein
VELNGIAVRFGFDGGQLGPEIKFDTAPSPSFFFVSQVDVADFNGDGFPDVAAVSGGAAGADCGTQGHGAFVFYNDGQGDFGTGQLVWTGSEPPFNGVTPLRAPGAPLPGLAVGHWCDGHLSIFPNVVMNP